MKIRKKICKILVCIPIMIFFGFHELQAFEVPLVVENPRAKKFRGVSRENAPVMGGVPLPPGQIKRTEELCLKDQYGSTVAVQISPMVRYQDGSLQWVLLNFLTNIKAGETLHFRLIKASGTAAVTNPVKVRNDSDSITLSNDILEIKLRRKGFNGISHLNLYGKEIIQSGGVPGVFMAGKGKFLAGEPVSARFEYRGLLRTTLCIKGPYVEFDSGTALDGFGYTLRLTMFANSPILRAEYLLKNTSVQRGQNLHIRQAWMDLQIVDANKVNVHGGSLTFRSSVGNGFFHIRHKGAFKKNLDCLSNVNGKMKINFVPAINDTIDESKSGTYYTNLKEEGAAYWLSDMSFKGTGIFMAFSETPVENLRAWSFRAKEPLHIRCPSEWYAKYDGFGVGFFGELKKEIETYRRWEWKGWNNRKKQTWGAFSLPEFHRQYMQVHNVSEVDQLRGLTIQYVRTGGRSYFDRATAWADYMKYHYVPRTEGFKIHDMVMSWKGWHWRQGRPLEGHLNGMIRWLNRGRADGCHDYGVGLGNYYLLTGDQDSLIALEDLCEKYSDLYLKAAPGKYATNPWGMRGIGRHLCITSRAYSILRTGEMERLMIQIARLILEDPNRDERGFIRKTKWLPRFKALLKSKNCPQPIRDLVAEKGIKIDRQGNPYSTEDGSWKLTQISAWQQAIVAMGLYAYYKQSGDEDARDYLIAFAEAMLKYCVSKTCGHVHSYTTIGFPIKDTGCNPERYWDWTNHCQSGKPGAHDGWCTRRLINTLVIGYRLSGRKHLLERAKYLWNRGSKVDWWSLPKAADNEVYRFAQIDRSTKNDDVSHATLLFHEYTYPRLDKVPPEAILNLKAKSLKSGKVELNWTAPSDNGGNVALYQLKHAALPIKMYNQFSYAQDEGKFRNWNFAKNVSGEPLPVEVNKLESMVVTGLKPGRYFFAVCSYDNSMNQSDISNLAEVEVQ